MSSVKIVQEKKVTAEKNSPEYRQYWTMKWNRETKTFSVEFDKSWWGNYPDANKKIDVGGIKVTKKQADIRHLQELLSEIAMTGDLENV